MMFGNYSTVTKSDGKQYLKLFGLKDSVKLANVELSNAVPALKNGQIDGFVTAGSYQAPNVIEGASSVGVKVIEGSRTRIQLFEGTVISISLSLYPALKRTETFSDILSYYQRNSLISNMLNLGIKKQIV